MLLLLLLLLPLDLPVGLLNGRLLHLLYWVLRPLCCM
jgi:hypothetical protein